MPSSGEWPGPRIDQRGGRAVPSGADAMEAVPLEHLGDHGRERLGRQSGPLMRWCEGDADLGGRRLIRDDAHGAVAAERPAAPVDRS